MDANVVWDKPQSLAFLGVDMSQASHREAELAQRALARLSRRDRTMLLLRANGLAFREIAGLLGVAEPSVGPLLLRAQRRFFAALAHHEPVLMSPRNYASP